jgi:hypothetical protein
VLPWTLLDTAEIPGDGGELRLHQRGSEYSIRVGTYELMNSRVHGSEDALASLVFERLRDEGQPLIRPSGTFSPRGGEKGDDEGGGPSPRLRGEGGAERRVRGEATLDAHRILIGGLGMGFTLAAVLRELGPRGEVVVAELVPAVVAWHRGPLAAVSGDALHDQRVSIREVDVAKVLRDERDAFDAILLDVDNGPAGLTSKKNDWLYSPAGLRAAFAALRGRGILAVWSAGPDAAFTRRLQQAGFTTEEVTVRGRGGKGPRYLIWMARRT